MEPIVALLLTAALAVVGHAVPLLQSNQCSQTCAVVDDAGGRPPIVVFAPQQTYYYAFESKSQLKSVQLGLTADVELSPLTPCEMQLVLSNVQLDAGLAADDQLRASLQQPLVFAYAGGRVESVCPQSSDSLESLNMKKALISLLQMSAKSSSVDSIVVEDDVLGQCETLYSPRPQSYYSSPLVMRKEKNLSACRRRQSADFGLFPRAYGLDELVARQSAPLMNASLACEQTIQKGVITGVECVERQTPFWSSAPLVQSQLSLRLTKQVAGIRNALAPEFRTPHKLLMAFDHKYAAPATDQLAVEADVQHTLRQTCAAIDAQQFDHTVVQLFRQLVVSGAQLSPSAVKRIDASLRSGQLCSSPKLHDLFLDAMALSATEASLQPLVEAVTSGRMGATRSAYLFSLLAFSSSGSQSALNTLLPLLQSRQASRQLVLAVSAFVHNLEHSRDHAYDSAPIDRVIELIVARVQSGQSNGHTVDTVAALHALGNIARVQHNSRAKQTLVSLALDTNADSSVRSAAIQALASADALDADIRRQLLSGVFEQKSQSNEVRIHAYKAIVMSGASRDTLDRIRSAINAGDEDEHVSNYVRSHQKNVRSSSDPSKRDVLPSGAPEFSPPQSSSLSVAQNMEFSYLNELANAGVVLESDLIYARQARVPRSVSINVSIPVFGKQLNVIELQVRQKGFGHVMQSLIGKLSKIGKNYSQILREMKHFFESNSISNSFGDRSSDSSFELFVKIDGKSVLVLDLLQDLPLAQDLFEQFQRMAEQLKTRVSVERAFATLFLDSSVRVPLATGIPFALKLNGTIVSALSANVKVDVSGAGQTSVVDMNVRPSFVAEIATGIEMQSSRNRNRNAKPLKFLNRFSFSPLIDLKAERIRRSFHFTLNVPNERQSLFKIESQILNELEPYSSSSSRSSGVSTCSGSAFGVALCQQISFKNGVSFEAFVAKSDKSMKGVELSIEAPDDYNDDTKRWRLAFNTPHSSVNREVSLELQMSSPARSDAKKEIRFQLQSPWKQLLASLSLRNEERERFVQMDVQSDGQQLFSLDVGFQNQTRGQKRELRPRVRVQWSGQREPIVLTGAVSMSRGRKNQISIQLENANSAHKQYLKGSVVREKSDARAHNNDMRVSGDLSLVLSDFIETRVSAVVDKTPKYALTELTVDYKLRKWSRKESLKMSAKVQNLTQSALHKLSAYADLSSSQFSSLNANFSYNLLKKSYEYLENEVSFGFARRPILHALQTTKYSNDASATRKMETTVSVRAPPLDVDYEVRATGLYDRSQPKYSLELLAKDRVGRKDRDLKAQFAYRHVSRSPLHVLIEMSAKQAGHDLAYRDEVRETAAGEYKGQTFVQWARGRSATLDYLYRTRTDGYPQQSQHELEAELKSSQHAYPIKHVAHLKMSREAFELKSKTHANGQQMYALETSLQRSGPSRAQLDIAGVSGKFAVNAFARPRTASIEVTSNDGRYHHKSDVEYDSQSSLAFKSDTKRNNQNMLALDALLSRAQPSRVVIASQPFDGRLDVIGGQKYSFEMLAKKAALAHSSQLTNDLNDGRRVVTFKSETKSNARPLLVIDSQYAPKQKSFLSVDAPAVGLFSLDATLPPRGQRSASVIIKSRSGAEHSSRADWSRANAELVSNSIAASGVPVLNVKYTKRDQSHAFSLDTPSFESRLSSPDGRDVTLGFVSRPNQIRHDTSVAFKSNGIAFDSQTTARDANLAKLNALLARDSASSFHLVTPQTVTRIGFEPRKSAKLEFDSPLNSLNHATQISYANGAYALDSRSRAHNNDYIVNGVLSRQSSLAAQFPAFDASLRFDKQSNSAKFDYKGKRANNAYDHVSELQFSPNEYAFKSQTNRLSDGQNVLSLDALLANRRSPSTFALKYGTGSEANIRVTPFSSIGVDARHKQYNHVSGLEFDQSANAVTLKSRTDKSNENINKIDAYFVPKFDQKSHIFYSSPKSNIQFEIEPQNSVKVEVRAHPFEHKTDARLRPTPAFVSTTTKSGQTLLNVNSAIGARSFVRVQSPLANGGLFLDADSAKLELQAPNALQHESTVRVIRPNGLTIDSASNWSSGRRFANVNARLIADPSAANRVSMDTHAFESSLDVSGRKAQFDFRSKLPAGRHVLASAAAPGSGFEVDVAWDRSRDPSKRVELVFRAETAARDTQAFSMRAQYGSSQVKALAEVNARDAMRGPNALTLDWIPSASDDQSVTLKLEHAMSGASMTCGLSYAVSGEKQFGAKMITSRTANAIKLKATADSPNDKAFDFDFDADLRRPSPNKYSADISAVTGISAKHSLKIDLQKSDDLFGSMSGSLAVETPALATPSKLDFDWNRKQKSFQTNFFARNTKQLEANAKLLDNTYGMTFDSISNIKSIPSIKGLFSLDTQSKAMVVTVDKDNVRVVDINSKLNSKNGINADFRLNDALSVSVKTKHTSDHVVYSLLVSRAANQLLDVELSLKNSVGNSWTASGHVVANGAELARASFGSSPAGNALQYALRAQSSLAKAWSPLVIEASKKSNSRELQYAIDLSSRDRQALKGKLHLKYGARHDSYPESAQIEINAPERAFDVQLEYALNAKSALPRDRYETSLLDASGQQKKFRTTGDRQTKLVVKANGQAFGFDARLPERSRNGYDAELKVFLPSGRAMTIRSDVAIDGNSLAAKADLQSSGDRTDKPLLTGSLHFDTGNGVEAHVSLSSPKFARNPKTISLISKQRTDGRPLDLKIELDVTSNSKNALTISAGVATNQLTGNRTATLTIASRDKHLVDLFVSGHVSRDESAGIAWHNRNRNGKLKSGFVALERQPTSAGKAFLITIGDQYSIRAQFSGDQKYASTVTVTSLANRKSTSVHTQLSDGCAQFDVRRDFSSDSSSLKLCADLSASHVMSLSAESTSNGEKTLDLNTRLDARGPKTLKVVADWSPALVSELLQQLADSADQWPDRLDSELLAEVAHKLSLISKQAIDEAVVPVTLVIVDQIEAELQALARQWPPLNALLQHVSLNYAQMRAKAYATLDEIASFAHSVTPDAVVELFDASVKSSSRAFRRLCSRHSNTCYQYLFAYDKYGVEGVAKLFVRKVYESARQAHHVVITSAGKLSSLSLSMPSIGDSRVAIAISRAINDAVDAAIDRLTRAVANDEDARQLVSQLRALGGQLSAEFDAIDWQKVKHALTELTSLLFSRQSWSSSSRVLLWEPERGHVELELHAPAGLHSHRLQAVMTRALAAVQSQPEKRTLA